MKRIRYFDHLRAFAILAVVILHVSGQNFRNIDIHSGDWFAMNIWESMSRWGVPVFAMISGALFLSSDYTIERLLRKNVLRIVIAFFSWSTIYLFLTNKNWNTASVGVGEIDRRILRDVRITWAQHAGNAQSELCHGIYRLFRVGVCTAPD